MKRFALWAALLIAVACGILAATRLMHMRSESIRALAVMAPAVNAVLEREGYRVEGQTVEGEDGTVLGVDQSGSSVFVVWGRAKLPVIGYKLTVHVQSEFHDESWRFSRVDTVLAAITGEVSRRCGYSSNESSDLSSETEGSFGYEAQ